MPCSEIMMPHVVCTDASYYTKNATSIDVTADEYAGNEAIETLTELVQTKTIERLSPAV